MKKVNPMFASHSTIPCVSSSIPTTETKSVEPTDVNQNVAASDCEPRVTNDGRSVGSSKNPTSKSRILENPRYVEINDFDKLSCGNCENLSSKNQVVNPESIVSKTGDTLLAKSTKENTNSLNVMLDVMTSLGHSGDSVETTQDKESETESTSKSENSQRKVVTDDDKEMKSFDDESNKDASSDENRHSESNDKALNNIDKEISKDDINVSGKGKDDGCMTKGDEENTECSEERKGFESTDVDRDQVDDTLNIEDVEFEDEPVGKRLTSSIANKLKKSKGNKFTLNAFLPHLPKKAILWVLLKVGAR